MTIEGRDDIREPLVALTFDDGPSEWTGQILQHLAEHDGHGTFFALGCLAADERRSPTLRRVVESGSEVGNHTPTRTLRCRRSGTRRSRTSSSEQAP